MALTQRALRFARGRSSPQTAMLTAPHAEYPLYASTSRDSSQHPCCSHRRSNPALCASLRHLFATKKTLREEPSPDLRTCMTESSPATNVAARHSPSAAASVHWNGIPRVCRGAPRCFWRSLSETRTKRAHVWGVRCLVRPHTRVLADVSQVGAGREAGDEGGGR